MSPDRVEPATTKAAGIGVMCVVLALGLAGVLACAEGSPEGGSQDDEGPAEGQTCPDYCREVAGGNDSSFASCLQGCTVRTCEDFCAEVAGGSDSSFNVCVQECGEGQVFLNELDNLLEAADSIPGVPLNTGAIVTIEGREFEFGFPDDVYSCSWMVGSPAIGEPEGLQVLANYRWSDLGSTHSFLRRTDGEINWSLYDSLTGEEWVDGTGTPVASLECADIEFYSTPEANQRVCIASVSGKAFERFSTREAFVDIEIWCQFGFYAPPEVPLDCADDDPCTAGYVTPRGGCIPIPRDSRVVAIDCELEGGGLGMCVQGECVEHACGDCDDGDPTTSDRCAAPIAGAPLVCENTAF